MAYLNIKNKLLINRGGFCNLVFYPSFYFTKIPFLNLSGENV